MSKKQKNAATKKSKTTGAARKQAAPTGTTGAAVTPVTPPLSALDAAAMVLGATGKAMRCRELVGAMTERALWSSPNGKTPHATLYSAMLREIATKGAKTRFLKADRGLFAFNG